VAAGVAAWKKVEVNLYLRGAAVLALDEFTDELVDGDNFQRYLPMVREWGRPTLVQEGAPTTFGLQGGSTVAIREISDAELGRIAAEHDIVMRF